MRSNNYGRIRIRIKIRRGFPHSEMRRGRESARQISSPSPARAVYCARLDFEPTIIKSGREYSTGELVRRLTALAWRYRGDFLLSLGLSLVLLVLGLIGLQLLGVVIDVIRHALDPTLQAPRYPFGWTPPARWSALQVVTALSLAIVGQALL